MNNRSPYPTHSAPSRQARTQVRHADREAEPVKAEGGGDLLILDPWGREAPETQRLEFCRLEGSRVTLQREEGGEG